MMHTPMKQRLTVLKIALAVALAAGAAGCRVVMDIPDDAPAKCGDNVRQPGEFCDGLDLGGATCESLGLGTGTLVCNLSCTGYITDACQSGPICGDDAAEDPETCDGTDLRHADCESLGHVGGMLACLSDCSGYDESGCHDCGNEILDFGETCDGPQIPATCASLGFDGGTLACRSDCSGYDTSGCRKCGNSVIENGEICDGSNLAGATCVTNGFDGGTLACRSDCSGYDTSGCRKCGNSGIEPGETCDDGNTGSGDGCSSTCQTEPFWTCNGMPSVCTTPCGDGHMLGAEACDDGNTQSGDGCFGCSVEAGWRCTGSPSTCVPFCGDDQIVGSEPCDGNNLNSKTCLDFGYCGGTLACKADCSGFNLSGCSSGGMCK